MSLKSNDQAQSFLSTPPPIHRENIGFVPSGNGAPSLASEAVIRGAETTEATVIPQRESAEPSHTYEFLKRTIDIIGAGALVVVTAPLYLLIVLVVKATSKGPVFYDSVRVGQDGHLFHFRKFRTMIEGADQLKGEIEHLNERDKILFKVANDPRVTSAGAFLRKYSLDELPQLWHVLMGEMSLVGPRPCLPEESAQYTPQQSLRLSVKPGITGLWQVTARHDPAFDVYVRLDLDYVERRNLMLDLRILWKTLPAVVRGTGS